MTVLYHDYFELRNVQEAVPGSGVYIRTTYDPNFSYVANADERASLNNDASRIAAFEARQTSRYQQGYEKFETRTTIQPIRTPRHKMKLTS